jgi:RNA polymerase sigma-70 factor (ECF subfamily)
VPLTLVASEAGNGLALAPIQAPRRPDGHLDWTRLMKRAQEGDREAYRKLLEDITPYLRSLAHRCFRDPSDVEDTVQDVLLTLHLVRYAYDPLRPFGPWLLSIANRRIVDQLRRQARERTRELAVALEHETFSGFRADADPPGESDQTQEAALQVAIGELSADQRQAINLLKLKEMSLREAALASGRSVAALKVATHRAIKNLRKRLLARSGSE